MPKKTCLRIGHRITGVVSGFVVAAAVISSGRGLREWMHRAPCFRVSDIEISGIDFLTREDVLKLGGLEDAGNIWTVGLARLESRILSNPFVESVHTQRLLPDILRIDIEEKKPLALLNFGGTLYSIDGKGMVLPSKPGRLYDMPVLTGKFEGGVRVGSPAGGELILKGLEFLRCVIEDRPEVYNQISEVVMGDERGLIVHTSRGGVTVFFGHGQEIEKIRCLEAALKQIAEKNEENDIRYIDLRFEGQVVLGMRT